MLLFKAIDLTTGFDITESHWNLFPELNNTPALLQKVTFLFTATNLLTSRKYNIADVFTVFVSSEVDLEVKLQLNYGDITLAPRFLKWPTSGLFD